MIRQKVDYGKYRYSQKEILKYIGESAALCGAVDYLFYQTPWVMLLVVPVSVFFLKWKKKQIIRERKRRLNYQFRDALNSMSVAVQAGYSVENAVSACVRDLEQLYPKNEDIVAEFRYIETQQRVSVPVEELFLDLGQRCKVEDIENFASVLYTAKRSGGDLGNVIQKVARMLGDKIDVKKEIEATLAAKKSEQMIMSLMPAGIILYLQLASPGFLDILYGNPFGICAMTVCLAVYGAAYWMGKRIVAIEVSWMWLHIVIFVILLLLTVCSTLGWIHVENIGTAKGRKMFLVVALAGNITGGLLTWTKGGGQVFEEGYELKKEESAYEEKFMVSVEGEETGSVYVQIPEKELEKEDTGQPEVLTKEEDEEQKLLEFVANYNSELEDSEYYYLPSDWEGRKLEWKIPYDTTGNMLAAIFLAAAFVMIVIIAREEQKARTKRYEELMMDYPGLIMKFTLLVQAGMTVRNTFRKMASDYKNKNEKRIAYEELVTACHEMESGISEMEAYRRFGERCGHVKYKTFATLLIQNLQKGSRHMGEMLEKESVEAWDDRKRKAKVQGEAATTKLLFPMILMLGVVMAIVMLPACLSFYG